MKKILILEDELMIGALYKRRLNLAGFGVQHAKDPDEMFKILNDFKPEVFLLDHGILGHEKTGTECIPKIREKFPKSKINLFLIKLHHTNSIS